MTLKKTMLTVAAVGAMTATYAVPAMALENEFHGMFRIRGIVSNFDDSAAGPVAIGAQPGSGGTAAAPKDPRTYTYVEQRARLMYIAKANDSLRLVTQFEFDSRFGDNSYNSNSSTRNNGGGIGADQTNLETKNVFLDFKIPSTPVSVKAGIQGFTDNYKGIIFNNDAAGVTAAAKFGASAIQAAWFRFDDATLGTGTATNAYQDVASVNTTDRFIVSQSGPTAGTIVPNPNFGRAAVTNQVVGHNTRDFMTVGGKYSLSKELTLGADYYLLYSDVLRRTRDKTYVHYVGANAEAKIGPATVNGFAIYQFGQLGTGIDANQDISAFAANVAAKMAVGPGTAKVTALLLTGDHNTGGTGTRNDFQTIMERGTTTSGHTFYEANSMLLLRNIYATAQTDRAISFDLNNQGRGIIVGFAGYDLALGKFYMNTNVGVGAVQKDNANTLPNGSRYTGDSNILGTELNTEIGYKLYDNMTASVQAAYLVLGDFYDRPGGKPSDPYTTRLMLNYTF